MRVAAEDPKVVLFGAGGDLAADLAAMGSARFSAMLKHAEIRQPFRT
jgi:hypothetical protein